MNNQEKQPEQALHQHHLTQIILSFQESQAIITAAKLGIADLLKDGPKSVDELAQLCHAHPETLYRLLRALASIGIFKEEDHTVFSLTPLSHYLRSDVEGSVHSLALMVGDTKAWSAWGDLIEGIKQGEVVFDHKFKMSFYDYHTENPEFAKYFNQTMFNHTSLLTQHVLEVYDFSPFQTIVDVGGNHGYLLSSILQKYPASRGVLFDQPFVIEAVEKEHLKNNPFHDRINAVAGNFFESLPKNGDVYIFKHIIHGFHDEKARQILQNCRDVIGDGTLLIIENVLSNKNNHSFSAFMDLQMIVMSGGKERTEAEYQQLLEQAGFQMTRVIHTSSPVSIIEAVAK
ncbi:methyltransferase [Thermoflavimicrobium daqui]|uniref:Methyltransferase n=1 Tax=Thermoflavimicrobium daqui TaxID=2137476 RepID=A0A364K460_9BACL|nr:methyltransferase [Thermoflavimicrobium daqui]RAL24049.1 methyltransferase [Thermoflavimicrobium daqui]